MKVLPCIKDKHHVVCLNKVTNYMLSKFVSFLSLFLNDSDNLRILFLFYKTSCICVHSETPRFPQERIQLLKELSQKPDCYERLARAIAPSIYENEDIKKGILLQLFGGTRKDFTNAGRGHFR